MNRVLLSIPAKNEANTVADVVRDGHNVLTQTMQVEADVLVISDGSTDATPSLAAEAGAIVIPHEKSRGLGNIFREAVEYAVLHKYDYLITIDGDKQFKESEIPLLLKPLLDDQADFTSGNRFLSGKKIEHMSTAKKYGNAMVAKIVNYILDSNYSDVSCGFRAYSRETLLHLNLMGGFTYTQEVFLNLGFKGMRILEVPISVVYFPERKSRIASKLFNYGYQVLKIMLSSLIYYRPMKVFGTLTILLWLLSIPTMLILSVRYVETGLITPYKSIGIIALSGFFLGIIFLLVGVILYALSRQQISIDKTLYYQRQSL